MVHFRKIIESFGTMGSELEDDEEYEDIDLEN